MIFVVAMCLKSGDCRLTPFAFWTLSDVLILPLYEVDMGLGKWVGCLIRRAPAIEDSRLVNQALVVHETHSQRILTCAIPMISRLFRS